MQLTEASYASGMPVDGYGPGFFRAAGKIHEGPLLLGPAGVIPWGGLADAAPLLALEGQVDVLFLGQGAEIAPLPAPLRAALEARRIGFEIMASPAAARTYNVLLSEGRRVAAALVPV